MARTRTDGPEVHGITGAQAPRSDDLEQRMGRYLLSMLIRTVCVVLVLVVDGPLRWVFIVGAVVLPYVAVILANSAGPRSSAPSASLGNHARAPRQIGRTTDDPDGGEPLVGTVLAPDEPAGPREPGATVTPPAQHRPPAA